MQKFLGWLLVIGAGLTILYNVVQTHYNQQQIEEHPWVTLFSEGENLKRACTFLPPYSGFEIVVIAILIIGGIVIFTAKEK